MKKIRLKPWQRYAAVFIGVMALNGMRWRFLPSDDPEGGNLLVNAVMALIVTTFYALLDALVRHRLRRNRKYKDEVMNLLNDKD